MQGAEIYDSLNSDVVRKLKNGAVGVVPTDTVYGLVCLAADEKAVTRLYSLKKRENKPGTVIAASIDQLVELGIPRRYLKAVEHFWPNPLSVIVPSGQALNYLHLGKGGLAVRIPRNGSLIKLLQQTGPLLTSSANHNGDPVANNVQESQKYFDDKVDFYVDGGDLNHNEPSTIIRIVDDAIEIIRPGSVKIDEAGRIS